MRSAKDASVRIKVGSATAEQTQRTKKTIQRIIQKMSEKNNRELTRRGVVLMRVRYSAYDFSPNDGGHIQNVDWIIRQVPVATLWLRGTIA